MAEVQRGGNPGDRGRRREGNDRSRLLWVSPLAHGNVSVGWGGGGEGGPRTGVVRGETGLSGSTGAVASGSAGVADAGGQWGLCQEARPGGGAGSSTAEGQGASP